MVRAVLRPDQSHQAAGKGFRGKHRERRGVPLRRLQRALAETPRSLTIRFEIDGVIGVSPG
jgi:hypothetical protein